MQSNADDIVYSSLFTGIHGSYLKGSIINAGLDPNNLKEGEKAIMDFGSDNTKTKAWRDIWGAGQGVGTMDDAPSVSDLIDKLEADYNLIKSELSN